MSISNEFYNRSQAQSDEDMQRQHGPLTDVQIVQFVEPLDKYECIFTFHDGFQMPTMRSRESATRFNLWQQEKQQQQQQYRSNVTQQQQPLQQVSRAQMDANGRGEQQRQIESEQRQRQRIVNQRGVPQRGQQTLREYAEKTPQRTPLLNGKLFTKDLLLQTQQGGIPEALK